MRNSLIRYSKLFRPGTPISKGARPRACLSRYPADRAGKGFPGVTLPADGGPVPPSRRQDRKSTRLNSSHLGISYAVFCLKEMPTTEIYTLSLHDALPIFILLIAPKKASQA